MSYAPNENHELCNGLDNKKMNVLTHSHDKISTAGKIWLPRLSKPTIVRPGEEFEINITYCDGADISSVMADKNDASGRLHLKGMQKNKAEGYALIVSSDHQMPHGLYDLSLYAEKKRIAFEPHCLWVCDPDPGPFTCAHISDLHILSSGKSQPRDRSVIIDNLMRYLAEDIRPDFIINTGDIVTRYDQNKELLPPEKVGWQIRQVKKILLKYRIPHFITPGNHDLARPFTRRDWLQDIGGAPDARRDDYSFSYCGVKFIAIDRSVYYNDDHNSLSNHITERRHEWLHEELESLPAGWKAVIFCHYDYGRELPPYLKKYRIFTVLYGHSSKPCIEEEFSDYDGGLRKPYDYQILELNDDGLTLMGHNTNIS